VGVAAESPTRSALHALPGEPVAGLAPAELERFQLGRAEFERDAEIQDGLGPLFNESACNRCHNRGGVGGAGLQTVVLAGRLDAGGFDSLSFEGGPAFAVTSVSQLRSASVRQAIPDCRLPSDGESVPERANVVARRRTTALFGLGLVDATPDATFIALAQKQPSKVRGRPAFVTNIVQQRLTLGKFGWKAQFPTLVQFAGAAFLNELGITNPEFSNEQTPFGKQALLLGCDLVPGLEDDGRKVRRATDFMTLLTPPSPLEQDPDARAGDALFTTIGCASCHVRTLTSGQSPIAALAHRDYHPFSDFLLHDMGALADGIGNDGAARPSEMRTAPLWGLHLNPDRLLHDGRAKTPASAITQHDGQALAARNAFNSLSEKQQHQLLAFLQTL
jgi:CxxC motif-containing protein (DUF1111 family)